MKDFLNNIRSVKNTISVNRKIINTLVILCFGIALGTFSKFIDNTASNDLSFVLEYLDVGNFLGRFAIWVLIAICISIYSNSPVRAALNVFVFLAGMISSYYLYSKFIAGFLPINYAMVWVGFTIVSPLLAFICWYVKGESKVSFVLSAIMIAVLFNMTFFYGWIYFDIRSILELVTFICGLVVLKRNTVKKSVFMLVTGLAVAFILDILVPFHFE